MSKPYILAIDQGTTSSRAIVFDREGKICSVAQKEFRQYFPDNGWVEHDPMDIWKTQAGVVAEAISEAGADGKSIDAIGITNQRETTVVWDADSGEPVFNAIVWQDRRTSSYCNQLKDEGYAEMIQEKTGLLIDSYFSATKIKWILDHVDGAREKANSGKLRFGTIDSWLIWNFTKGDIHVTDITNASRTMLYNIRDHCWDDELLELFDIPESMLPEVKSSSEVYGNTRTTIFAHEVPIAGIAGDQQAAMFGQMCTGKGMIKNTYGTGAFMMFNTGSEIINSQNKLLSTVGWQIGEDTVYALEGSIFIAGAVVQWLRDGLGLIKKSSDIENLARNVDDNGGVYFVPALSGLGAPYWDQQARGSIQGLSRGTEAGHIARAALEGIAFRVADVLQAMESDSGIKTEELRVDGGATANNLLMQFQADILQVPLVRPEVLETTALGAAYLAGLATGFWNSTDDIEQQWKADRRFEPEISADEAEVYLKKWRRAVEGSKGWLS